MFHCLPNDIETTNPPPPQKKKKKNQKRGMGGGGGGREGGQDGKWSHFPSFVFNPFLRALSKAVSEICTPRDAHLKRLHLKKDGVGPVDNRPSIN